MLKLIHFLNAVSLKTLYFFLNTFEDHDICLTDFVCFVVGFAGFLVFFF